MTQLHKRLDQPHVLKRRPNDAVVEPAEECSPKEVLSGFNDSTNERWNGLSGFSQRVQPEQPDRLQLF